MSTPAHSRSTSYRPTYRVFYWILVLDVLILGLCVAIPMLSVVARLLDIPYPIVLVLGAIEALFARFASRQDASFAGKVRLTTGGVVSATTRTVADPKLPPASSATVISMARPG